MNSRNIILIMKWLAAVAGLAVAVFVVYEELCLATACRDTASFTLFGLGMGWFGIAYFSGILALLWLGRRNTLLELICALSVFSGIGAELRLLWIQKFVIGAWCPLCVSICCALVTLALLILAEKIAATVSGELSKKNFTLWGLGMLAMIIAGLVIAYAGVSALT